MIFAIDSNTLNMRVLLSQFKRQPRRHVMKTMTCSQLGGACDLPLVGEDANEIIKAQDRHLREAVAAGNSDHEPALGDMKGRWRHPVSGMKWYKKVQRDFAALPSDTVSH
jgi:predicted small metal-binding protein